jgi:hypothetical protein
MTLSPGAAIAVKLQHGASRAGFIISSSVTLAHHSIPVGRREIRRTDYCATAGTINTGRPEKNRPESAGFARHRRLG